jgi:predicted kinase
MQAGGSRLIIICGLPGAGKTTLAKTFEAQHGAIRMCPDEWMESLDINHWDEAKRSKVESFQWSLTKQLLQLGLTVIIEWGTWGRSERDALRLGAKSLGAAVELHYVSAPLDELFERIHRRGMEDPPVTREQLEQWSRLFEVPTAEEMSLYDNPTNVS